MRTTLLILAACLAVLAPAATAGADTWSAPLTIPRSTNEVGPTQLLVNGNGNATVIARGNIGFKSQILQSQQFAADAFAPFGRAFSGTDTQGANDFEYDARGDGVMAGLSGHKHGPSFVALRATRRPGSTFAPRQEVSPGETQATTLKIAISARGDALAVWVARIHGRHRIAYVMRTAGHRFGARHLLSFAVPTSRHAGFDIQPQPAVDATGRIAIVFGDGAGTMRIATGFLSRGFTATQAMGPGASRLSAVALDQGRGVAAWWDTSGAAPVLRVARRERGQAAFGAAAELSGSAPPAVLGTPLVAMAGDGAAIVAGIVAGERAAAWRAAPLTPFGDAELVSGTGRTAYSPSLAVAPDGGATLAFQSTATSTTWAIEATVLRSGESQFGPATVVAPAQRQFAGPIAGAGSGGRAAVAYNDSAVRVSRLTG